MRGGGTPPGGAGALGERRPVWRFSPPPGVEPGGSWRDDERDTSRVVQLPALLAPEQCDRLLGLIDELGQAPGAVAGRDGREQLLADVRRVQASPLPFSDASAWVYEAVGRAVDACNRDVFRFDVRDFNEHLSIVDYRSGDFYQWHLDVGRDATRESLRKLSVSVALSAPEDYEGGQLVFPTTTIDRPRRGSAVVFPSFLLHGVRPVTRGRRCALLAWVGGPPFR